MVHLQSPSDFIEQLAADSVDGVVACMFLPTANCNIDIQRINLDSGTDPADTLCSKQSATRTQKTIENDFTTSGAIQQGIGDQSNWLNCRMES